MGRCSTTAGVEGGDRDRRSFPVLRGGRVVRASTRRCERCPRPRCAYGIPTQVLTDSGKVFTGRYNSRPVEVLFDRMCQENGVEHILTAHARRPRPGRSSASTAPCAGLAEAQVMIDGRKPARDRQLPVCFAAEERGATTRDDRQLLGPAIRGVTSSPRVVPSSPRSRIPPACSCCGSACARAVPARGHRARAIYSTDRSVRAQPSS